MRAAENGETDERREHIVEVAEGEFLAGGFAYTTMDGIAKAAKVSKQTLYRCFRDKAALFEAVVEREMRPFRDPPNLTQDDRPFEDVLFEIVCWNYDNSVSWHARAMNKMLISTASEFGELVSDQHAYRFQISTSWVTDYLKSLTDRGFLKIPDPVRATFRLMHMSSQGSRSMMGYEMPSGETRERFARLTVRLFVHGLRSESGHRAGPRLS